MRYFSFLLAVIFLGINSTDYAIPDGIIYVDQELVNLDKRLDVMMKDLDLVKRKLNAVSDSRDTILKIIPYVIVAGVILIAVSYYLDSVDNFEKEE